MSKTGRLIGLLMALIWLGCPLIAAQAGDRVIKDMAGRRVKVPQNPKRIVCLAPGALRLIVYLQAQDLVVGVEMMEKKNPCGRPYWIANTHMAKLPAVGPGGAGAINREPDLEALLRVNPQVVFITNLDPALADRVQARLGLPVVVLDYGRFASFDAVVYDSLRLAGRILGREKRAEAVISFIEGVRGDLAARTSGLAPSQRAGAYVGGLGFRGGRGLDSTDADYLPFDWTHVKNLARAWGSGGHLFADREKILALDPPVIFVDAGGLERIGDDMLKHPRFYAGLRAFRQKRVHLLLPFNWYTTNIGTALADAYAIGKILYPERFSDLDPAGKADQIYRFLVGRPVYRRMAACYGELGRPLEFGKRAASPRGRRP